MQESSLRETIRSKTDEPNGEQFEMVTACEHTREVGLRYSYC